MAASMSPLRGPDGRLLQDDHARALIIQPVNMFEDKVPMEFDMALAVPRAGRISRQPSSSRRAAQERDTANSQRLRRALVKCDECLISAICRRTVLTNPRNPAYKQRPSTRRHSAPD